MSPSLTQRQHMVESQLLTSYVLDADILKAMTDVPREQFVPENLRGSAYVDEDIEVAPGRWLMAPLTFARLLALAEIAPDNRVLVIGALNGYCAAVLSKLSASVIATETSVPMIESAQAQFKQLHITNVRIHQVNSLAQGYAGAAPYDVIVIPGAVGFLPEVIGSQLTIGGRLVTVKNIATRADAKFGLGKGWLVTRLHNQLQQREHFDASSAMLPGFDRADSFAF